MSAAAGPTSTPTSTPARARFVGFHHWPAVLGLAAAVAALASGGDRDGVAITLGVAALCYLAAAALRRRWVAWAAIPTGTGVVVVSEVAGVPWWIGLGAVAVALVGTGLVLGASRPALTAQALALVGFGGLAVGTLYLAPRLGLVLAGLLLAGHAVWDLVHLRHRVVVPRSLAEFCMALDVPLGLGAVALALFG